MNTRTKYIVIENVALSLGEDGKLNITNMIAVQTSAGKLESIPDHENWIYVGDVEDWNQSPWEVYGSMPRADIEIYMAFLSL